MFIQLLLTAHNQQLETETGVLRTKQAENERLQQEIRQMNKNAADMELRSVQKKNDLEKGLARVEKLKAESSWDGDALCAWEEALKKRDEDNELLKKFSKEDQRKANELEARRQNLQVEVGKRRQLVEKLSADLNSYEQILDRTGRWRYF